MNSKFNKTDIEIALLDVVNRVHPFYREVKPYVSIYDRTKYRNLEFDKVRLDVNYDHFGYVENRNGKMVASGSVMGVGYIKEFDTINDAIEFLVREYFHQ